MTFSIQAIRIVSYHDPQNNEAYCNYSLFMYTDLFEIRFFSGYKFRYLELEDDRFSLLGTPDPIASYSCQV